MNLQWVLDSSKANCKDMGCIGHCYHYSVNSILIFPSRLIEKISYTSHTHNAEKEIFDCHLALPLALQLQQHGKIIEIVVGD